MVRQVCIPSQERGNEGSSEHKMGSQIIIYLSSEGNIKVDVHLEDSVVRKFRMTSQMRVFTII